MTGRLRGGLLTALSRIVTQGSQLATFMVAAASMSPEDFGVFALVSAAVVILTTVAGSGWPEYAMQWSGTRERLRQVLALAILSGAVISALCFFLGMTVPYFTDIGSAKPLMELFSLTIILYSAANTLNGIQIWQHQMAAAAMAIILGEVAGMIVAVSLLYSGEGVFALAWGKIAGGLVWLGIGAATTRITPDFRLSRHILRDVFRFSANIISVRMIITLRAYSGTILVGFFLGAGEAGFFRAAQRLAGAVSEIVGEPARVLSWSLFRETRDRPEGIGGFQARANMLLPLILALSLPCFTTLIFAGEDLVTGLLGAEWAPAGPVLAALATTAIIFAFGSTTEPMLSLAGAVKVMPRMVSENLATGVLFTIAAGPFGLLAIAWAQAAAAMVIVIWNARILRKDAKVKLEEVLWHSRFQLPAILISLALTYAIARYILPIGIYPFVRFILFGVINAAIFIAILVIVDTRLRNAVNKLILRRNL